MRILYVEASSGDEDLLRRTLVTESSEFESVHVATLGEALQEIERRPFAAVLLDLGLPDSTQLESLQLLHTAHEEVPILVVTGHEDDAFRQLVLQHGAMDYLVKGRWDGYHLRRAIAQAIERQRGLEALADSKRRYELVAEAASDPLWDWSPLSNEGYFSSRLRELLGWSPSFRPTLVDWLGGIHPDDAGTVQAALDACLDGRSELLETEYRLREPNADRARWMYVRGRVQRDAQGAVTRLACSQRDVTERKEQEERIHHDAYHDPVTGLPNRALLLDRIAQAVARQHRHRDQEFAVLFMDMDDFKLVNDSLGHLAGDRVLIAVGERLRQCVRPEDTVGRLGGDEFVILLENAGGTRGAMKVADRIVHALIDPINVGNHELFARASIGITVGRGAGQSPEDILREADTALYRAKARGGGSYEVFDRSMQEQAMPSCNSRQTSSGPGSAASSPCSTSRFSTSGSKGCRASRPSSAGTIRRGDCSDPTPSCRRRRACT